MGSMPIHVICKWKNALLPYWWKIFHCTKGFMQQKKKEKEFAKLKKQCTEWRKFCKTYVSNKGLISRVYKELIQPNNNNKKTIQLKVGQRNQVDICPRKLSKRLMHACALRRCVRLSVTLCKPVRLLCPSVSPSKTTGVGVMPSPRGSYPLRDRTYVSRGSSIAG